MRSIKFRVWDTTLDEMLDMKEIQQSGMNLFVLCEGVKIMKLMQYTGLKDKNGKEIYEGDIVKWLDAPLHKDNGEFIEDVIVYKDGCFRTRKYNELLSNLARTKDSGGFNYLVHHKTEVIGNRFEHPHLLEESK